MTRSFTIVVEDTWHSDGRQEPGFQVDKIEGFEYTIYMRYGKSTGYFVTYIEEVSQYE